jgi:hypothetical protein
LSGGTEGAKPVEPEGLGLAGELTLRGIVIATEWSPDGSTRSISLSTAGETDYPIEPSGAGLALASLVRQEVIVRASLASARPTPLLIVKAFEIVEPTPTSSPP